MMARATTETNKKQDIELLNRSLGGEYFGIAAYQAALGSGLLEDAVRAVAEKFQGDHKQHAQRIQEAITALGGDPIQTKSWEEYASEFPPPPLKSQADVLHYAASLEQSGAVASVASVAEFSSPELSLLAASIAGVEAMHWSALLGHWARIPSRSASFPHLLSESEQEGKSSMAQPSQGELAQALADAGSVHHDYEQGFLRGSRDEQWPGFYAAYALGRLGDFVEPSTLSSWLEESPAGDHWPTSAAIHVLERLTA